MKKMFALTVGAFAALLAAAPLAIAQDGDRQTVRIDGTARPNTGDVRKDTQRQSVEVYMGETLLKQETTTASKTAEVLAAEDGKITKAKITYHEVKTSGTAMGPQGPQKTDVVQPFSGKTYIIERTEDGETKVTYENGDEVPFEEMVGVLEDNDNLGDEDNPLADLIGRDLTVGSEIDFPEAMLESFTENGGVTIDNAKLTVVGYCEVDGVKCVKFGIKIDMNSQTPAGPMKVNFTGELIVQAATCWPVKMAMAGPLAMDAQGMKITGKMDIGNSAKYARATGAGDDDND